MPGFREGYVSYVIFNQHYGEEALYEDTLNLVLPNAYTTAAKEVKIETIGQPKVESVSMNRDKA